MRKERGITLVSLVVTIIILIILAGVSINLTLGENGIITKSKQAKEKTEQATLNEQIALNELYMQIEAEGGEGSNVYIGKLTEFKKEIADYIEEAGGVKPEYTADTITFGESIKGIVKEVTKDATATAEDITEGKTAWVNGELFTGTATKPDINLNMVLVACYWDGDGQTRNSYITINTNGYKKLTVRAGVSNYIQLRGDGKTIKTIGTTQETIDISNYSSITLINTEQYLATISVSAKLSM